MKKLSVVFALLVLIGSMASSCGTNTGDPITSGEAFRDAFPEQDVLYAPVPGLESGNNFSGESYATVEQALVGQRAWLNDLSFMVAWQVNSQAFLVFSSLWFITRFPPTMAVAEEGVIGEGEDQLEYDARAVWGPYKDNGGKNLEYILHVWRATDPDDGRRVFVWYAAARPMESSDSEWVIFMLGGANPFTNTPDGINRMGIVEISLDAFKTLDPSHDNVGYATYAYVQGTGFHAVAAVGEGVWTDKNHDQTGNVNYFYGRSAEGYAVFDFDTQANVPDPNLPGNLFENLHVTTGWVSSGGRSDATISGGDLGDQSATMTQCWGLDIKQSYFRLALPPPAEPIEDGDVNSCFTPDPVEIPDVDYEAIRDMFKFDF